MSRQVERLLEGGRFFEGPRWHDGRWWVSDFYRHAVYAVSADGAAEPIVQVPGQPSGLGWMPDGSMLIVSMKDHRLLRRLPDGELRVHADLAPYCGGHANDLVVDARGGAWVGNFGFDLMGGGGAAPTVLVRVEPDGGARVAADGLLFPNGMVITPDGRTLIVGESMGNRYTAFDIAENGDLGNRRSWAQFGPEPRLGSVPEVLGQLKLAPDGCALDAENHIWAADAIGARCARVAPGGEVVDEVRVPDGLGIFACMLGGEDGRTLLLCCAPDFFEHNREHVNEALLMTTRVAVPHAGRP